MRKSTKQTITMRREFALQPTFTKRTTPLSEAELASLEIPEFLKRS